jgi:hypothetical protein
VYAGVAMANVALLLTAGLAAATGAIVDRGRTDSGDSARVVRASHGALALLGTAGVYAFGSNNGFLAQTNGATVLVLAAVAALGIIPLTPRGGGGFLSIWAPGIALIAVVVLASARAHPYRMAPLDTATETIAFGRHGQPLAVDPAAAAYWRQLTDGAHSACWVPGTRLLDLTWNPADAYALDATVPEVLIPLAGQFVTGTASAQEALRVSNPAAWREGWLLTSPDIPEVDPAAVVAVAGRVFPSDYALVTTLTSPGLHLDQQLWRPADAPAC